MTIAQAIAAVDALTPNTFDQETKIAWLSRLDHQVQRELIETHAGATVFDGYTPDTPLDTALLMGAPYDECYIRYLQAQIHYENGEIARYKNAMALFNSVYASFADHYNRTHLPLSCGSFR